MARYMGALMSAQHPGCLVLMVMNKADDSLMVALMVEHVEPQQCVWEAPCELCWLEIDYCVLGASKRYCIVWSGL